jgi:hypothetical protein
MRFVIAKTKFGLLVLTTESTAFAECQLPGVPILLTAIDDADGHSDSWGGFEDFARLQVWAQRSERSPAERAAVAAYLAALPTMRSLQQAACTRVTGIATLANGKWQRDRLAGLSATYARQHPGAWWTPAVPRLAARSDMTGGSSK